MISLQRSLNSQMICLIRGTEKDEDGDHLPVQVRRTKIKLGGKLQALEMLAKFRKLLTDKVEHTDADGDNVRVLWIGKEKNGRIPVSAPQNLCTTIGYHSGEDCRGGEFRGLSVLCC
jgi:hypothetical protein